MAVAVKTLTLLACTPRLRFYAAIKQTVGMKRTRNSVRFASDCCLFCCSPLSSASKKKGHTRANISFTAGTYTGEGTKSEGIYAFRYDAATAQVTPLGLAAETTNPSFVAAHPNGTVLYAVNEVGDYKGPIQRRRSACIVDRPADGQAHLPE